MLFMEITRILFFDRQEGLQIEHIVETKGHSFTGDIHFKVSLTVTNHHKLSTTHSIVLRPLKVDIVLQSSPMNFPVNVDGIPFQTPIRFDTLVYFQHAISTVSSAFTA